MICGILTIAKNTICISIGLVRLAIISDAICQKQGTTHNKWENFSNPHIWQSLKSIEFQKKIRQFADGFGGRKKRKCLNFNDFPWFFPYFWRSCSVCAKIFRLDSWKVILAYVRMPKWNPPYQLVGRSWFERIEFFSSISNCGVLISTRYALDMISMAVKAEKGTILHLNLTKMERGENNANMFGFVFIVLFLNRYLWRCWDSRPNRTIEIRTRE